MSHTILCVFVLLALFPMLALAASTPPVTLAASLERPVCPEGQPVVLSLALHNAGTENLIIGGSAFEESSFQLTVTDEAGRAVPRTSLGDRVLTPPTSVFANSMVRLNSGQALQCRFNLARLFDLSRTGTYAVSVSRTLAPWPFPVAPSQPGTPAPPKVINLAAGPLKFGMVEDADATSGLAALTPPPDHQTFLYMVSLYDTGVSRWRVAEDGRVSFTFDTPPPAASPVVGRGANSIAATPDGRFLYVCNGGDETVSQFRVGIDGELSPLSPPAAPTAKNPWFLLMDPRGRFLYALSSAGSVRYTIGPDGRLTAHVPASGAWDPVHNVPPGYSGAIDSTGTFLYVCNGFTYGYRLAPDGAVTALPTPASGAAGPNGGRDNAVALSPSGKFAFVGVSTTDASGGFDRVAPMRVKADGTLTPIPGAAQTPQAPPLPWAGFQPFFCKTLVVDPTGCFLIVVNPGYLDCYRIGADGSLTPLGMTTQNGDLDAVFFGSGGHVVYAVNRNPPSLLAFRLDNQRGLVPAGLDMPSGVPFAVSIASAVAPTPIHWGPTVGGLTISARLPADVLPAAAPVVLTVVLKNVTSRPIRLGTAGADMASFRLSLTGPQRQFPGVLRGGGEPAAAAAPLLAAGYDLLDAPGTGGAALMLPAGGQRQYRFVLSRLADLSVAGNYTLQVSRVLPGGTVAASPVLHVLLEGPFNGITRIGNRSELNVL